MRALALVVLVTGCMTDANVAQVESDLSFTTSECRRDDVLLGACGGPREMFVACTDAFTTYCHRNGGDIVTTVPLAMSCSNTNPYLRPCDLHFITYRQNELHGSFRCTSSGCQTGECGGFP